MGVRADPKSVGSRLQARCRERALEAQRRAREELTARSRELALALDTSDTESPTAPNVEIASDTGPTADPLLSPPPQRPHQIYASQFMHPEWLLAPPPSLASDWLVATRPQGRRCLLVARGGWTSVRLLSGSVLERFRSALPGGHGVARGGHGTSVVEAVRVEGANERTPAYVVTDVLCWKGLWVCDSGAEFRREWLQMEWEEVAAAEKSAGGAGDPWRKLERLTWAPASPNGIERAYGRACDAVASASGLFDGLLFMHRECPYLGGISPLLLAWKDGRCSLYPVDTDAEGVPLPRPVAVLACLEDGTVGTSDSPPVVLGQLPRSFLDALGTRVGAGRLLRFEVGEQGVTADEAGTVTGASLRFVAAAGRKRGRADQLSRLLFQLAQRSVPVTIEHILNGEADRDMQH